jgi:Pin2-interacting protein X1
MVNISFAWIAPITSSPSPSFLPTDAGRFGQAYLEKFGWDASKGLGASGEGRTNAVKAAQKLDMLGIGMRQQNDVEGGIAWRQNRDFEDLLRRLNDGTATETGNGTGPLQSHKVRESESESLEGGVKDDGGEEEREDVMTKKEKEKKKKKKRKATTEGEEEEGLDSKERKKKRKKSSSSSSKDGDDDGRTMPSSIVSEAPPPRPPPAGESESAPMATATAIATTVTAPVPVRAPYVARTFRG